MFKPVKLRLYLDIFRQRGHEAAAILANTAIGEAQLRAPDCLIDAAATIRIIGNIIRLAGDDGIGLDIGRDTQLSQLGVVGHAISVAPTIHDATELWTKFSNVLLDGLVTTQIVKRSPDDWGIRFTDDDPRGGVYRFCIEENLMLIRNLGAILLGRPPCFRRLELSYQRPRYFSRYNDLFRCPIRFDAPDTIVYFSSPRLDSVVAGSDQGFYRVAREYCEQMSRRIRSEAPVSEKLRQTFSRCHDEVAAATVAARLLGMSQRTLNRRLGEEGTSYRRVSDGFRAERTAHFLRCGMTLKEIGHRLGYSDTETFRRALRRWPDRTECPAARAEGLSAAT